MGSDLVTPGWLFLASQSFISFNFCFKSPFQNSDFNFNTFLGLIVVLAATWVDSCPFQTPIQIDQICSSVDLASNEKSHHLESKTFTFNTNEAPSEITVATTKLVVATVISAAAKVVKTTYLSTRLSASI